MLARGAHPFVPFMGDAPRRGSTLYKGVGKPEREYPDAEDGNEHMKP